ncbi:UNVERIFIED_CONTAM: hypothetical protein Slati_0763900 [Sesamum latifolium]|uniref:Reverse transcriptase domain-containing protein n=1 Tax=Sesamum latifolium TaxID=2727402 RepID=A0AAW2XMT6_9LAMI
MPFGLKNVGATYQRLVDKIFRLQLCKTMKVYVDDMLVKSKEARNHVEDLEETFAVLRKYRLKLNPEKCAFGVSGGRFLRFMVAQRVDSSQIRQKGPAILQNTKKDQGFQMDRRVPTSVRGTQGVFGKAPFASKADTRGYPLPLPILDVPGRQLCAGAKTNTPLKQVLGKPEASGQLAKWAIELSEYDISYPPRTTIKA